MFRSLTSQLGCLVVLILVGLRGAEAFAPPNTLQGDDKALLDSVEQHRRLVASLVRIEVENQLRSARQQMADEPAEVEQQLKLTLARLLQAPELQDATRAQLRQQLEMALREANRRVATRDVVEQQEAQQRAAARDRLRVADSLVRGQERVRQLMDRFESLMDEGRFTAASAVADRVEEAGVEAPTAGSAAWNSRLRQSLAELQASRISRQRGVVRTLLTVETALTPQPDDQPITFPDATVWEQLTLSRARRATTDMRRATQPEAKIRQALGESTTVEFVETPLIDVVEYLKDLHGIEIQLDTKSLGDERIPHETPITIKMKGTSLRTALRSMLEAIDLTYLVRDEVLLVTTPSRAANELSTRVYPIGDLVTPIRPVMGNMLGSSMTGSMGPGSSMGQPGGLPGMQQGNGPGQGFQ